MSIVFCDSACSWNKLYHLYIIFVVDRHLSTNCSWLDERTDLNNVVRTIMISQQPCSYMIEYVVKLEWWNNKIQQRCYNNHEHGCCIKSGFACSNIPEQPLSIRQAVYKCWNMIEQILLFYQSCSIMLTVLYYRVVESTTL